MTDLKLTRWQRLRLQRQLKDTHDVRIYQRTLAILEASRGRSVAEIAQILGATRQSVSNLIEAYAQAHAPSALLDENRSGRPGRWTEDLHGLLPTLLEHAPDQLGYFTVNWTVPLLQEELEHRRVTGWGFDNDRLYKQ
jgi:transposase